MKARMKDMNVAAGGRLAQRLTQALLPALLFSALALPTYADDWHRGPREFHDGHDFHEGRREFRREEWGWHGDIHRFHDHDFVVWRGGRWFHGPYLGRPGWWWVVGDAWYYYPAPIYPYPDPYIPPTAAAPPPGQQYWYYCANPQGYYPYVPQCSVPWQPVAPQPAG